MPNTKQKQLMKEEKRRRATAFGEQQMRQLGHEADQGSVPLVFSKMPVKTRKRLKGKEWKPGEINKSVDEIKS